jgi:hypothetical protein
LLTGERVQRAAACPPDGTPVGRAQENVHGALVSSARCRTAAVTRPSDRSDPVPDAVWDEAARHDDEKGLAALTLCIATNVFDRLNVATGKSRARGSRKSASDPRMPAADSRSTTDVAE